MAGGYSTQSFMTGLADGIRLGNEVIDSQRRREQEDAQAARQKVVQAREDEQWGFTQEDRQRRIATEDEARARQKVIQEREDTQWSEQQRLAKKNEGRSDAEYSYQTNQRNTADLEKEMQRDLRRMYQSNISPDDAFFKKYSSLGVDKLFSTDWQNQKLNAGQKVVTALKTGKVGAETLDAMNAVLGPNLQERTQADGLQRKITGARLLQNGNWALELEVTGKDGKPYKAPVTKNGTADAADEIFQLSPTTLEEWLKVSLGQGNAAYMMKTAGVAPANQIAAAHKAYYGQNIEPAAKYSYQKGYDDQGREVLMQFDQNGNYKQVGGGKQGTGAGGSADLNADDQLLWDALQQFQKDGAMDQDGAAIAFESSIGIPIDVVHLAQADKRANGDFTPITFSDLNQFMSKAEAYPTENNAPSVQQGGGTSTPPPRQAPISRQQQLESKLNNPIYPPNAQADFAEELESLNEQGSKEAPQKAGQPKPATFDDKMAVLQARLNSAKDQTEVTAITKEMADLAMSQNAGLSSAHYAGI